MATVDDRVVAMSFENGKFNSDIDSTIGVLGRLKQALNLDGAARGLEDINAAGQQVDLSHIGQAVAGISSGFSVLGGAAAVVLGNIATKALEVGGQVVKSFSLDPIMAGFRNYETQINAVQTIMANTGLTGAQGLGKVNAVLKDMQNYANLTVYNFAEMAKNIGTFTAAGVDLKTAQESIKGIANLAALSGSSSEQASSAMYQLSQAIASGKVQLQDWNSVVNAGIGGRVLQEALFNTAKAMGTLKDVPLGESFDEWTKKSGGFRASLQRGAQSAQDSESPIAKLAQVHKDAARTIEDAQRQAADAVASAAQRVKDAQRGVGDSVRQSAQAIASATDGVRQAQQASADAVRQAAKDIQGAMDGVSQAQQSLANTNRQASQDIANAVQQEHQTILQSAQSVRDALLSVIDARRKLAEAMKPPSADELQAAQDKLTTSQLDQKDLTDAVTKAQEEQTRATQDLGFAQENLAKLMASGTATPDQIIMAQRQVQDAQQKVKDLTDAQTRALLQQHAAARAVDQAETDLTATREKGTKADKNVQTAQDALTKALRAYHDAQIKSQHDIAAAEQNVRDVRIKSAQSQIAAQEALTKAEQNLSDTRIKAAQNETNAQQAVTKAEQNLANVRITQAENEQKAQEALAQAEHDQAKARIDSAESVARAHEQAAKTIQAAEQAVKPKSQQGETWLTSGVLTNTLKQFSGDMTTAQLKAQGFTDAQIAHIEAMGKTAINAATQIKTFSQLMQALKEEVGTAWGAVFKTIFGDIDQAKGLFSPLHTAVENFLTGPIYGLNRVLEGWAKAGGRTALIDAFKTAWEGVASVLHAIRLAWDDIFPAVSGSGLANLTKNFDEFVHRLTPSTKTLDELKRIFQGLFAVLDIGKTIVGDVFHLFAHLFGVVTPSAGGGFLALAAHVGDLLVKFDQMVKSGHFLTDFFASLGRFIDHPLQAFKDLGITLPPLSGVMKDLQKIWDAFTGSLQKSSGVLGPLASSLGHLFNAVVGFLTNTFQNLNFDQVLHAIDTGLLGGIYLLFKRFFTGAKLTDLAGGGIFKGIKEVLEGTTGSLKQMQSTLKAATLLEIGVAVAALATALLEIGKIPADRLKASLTGIGVLMAELAAAMKVISLLSAGGLGVFKLTGLASGMIILAGAVDLLTVAVKGLAQLNWPQLEKGLTGVGILLAEISVAMGPISRNSAGMAAAGLGIIGIATGIRILAGAVEKFSTLSWGQLAKGLSAVGATLVGIGLSTKLFPTGMVRIGLGLVEIAGAMKLLASALGDFGNMDWNTIGRGLFSMGAALGIIALAVNSMPKGMILQATALNLVAVALIGIGHAIGSIGRLDGNVIGKGLLGIGLALTELAVALDAMESALPGAAALVVAATGLDLLTPAIKILGSMSVGDLAKGLVAMGIALGGLALGAQLLEPAAPALLAMGFALTSLGVAIALIGGGVFLLGTGLSEIAIAGPAAVAILLKALEGFAASVPKLLSGVVDSIVHVAVALANSAPQIVTALGKLLIALGQAIINAAPVLAKAGIALIEGLLKVITKAYPDIIKAGLGLLNALLKGIADNIGKVTTQVAHIISRFLNALASHLSEIISSGANLLVKFLGGIGNNLTKVAAAAVNVVFHFIGGIASNLGHIVTSGANLIGKFIAAVSSGGLQMLRTGANIIVHFLSGVASLGRQVIQGATHVVGVFISSATTAALGLIDTGARAVIHFLNGVAGAIRKYNTQLWNAGWNIVNAIIDGMINGIETLGGHMIEKFEHLFTSLPDKALHILGIKSPSTVFYAIGQNVIQGLTNGISNNSTGPTDAIKGLADSMVSTMQTANSTINDLLDFHTPTVTPVLDLSEIKKNAYLIQGYMPSIAAPANIALAAGGQSSAQDTPTSTDTSGPGGVPTVNYTQNNYSPEALSEIDIYRQTKNQLSQFGSTFSSDSAYFARSK